MQLKKMAMYSGITSTIVLITSIFIPIIPCRKAPNIIPLTYKWTMCNLNPDKVLSLSSITEYLGYTSSIRDTYILTLLITFIITMMFLHYTTRGKNKKK